MLGSGHAIQAGQARSTKVRLLEACTNRSFLSAKAAGHSARIDCIDMFTCRANSAAQRPGD